MNNSLKQAADAKISNFSKTVTLGSSVYELVDQSKAIDVIDELHDSLQFVWLRRMQIQAKRKANQSFKAIWEKLKGLEDWEGHLDLMVFVWIQTRSSNKKTIHSLSKWCHYHRNKSKEELEQIFYNSFKPSQSFDPADPIARYIHADD